MPSLVMEDREERHFLTMEDVQDNTVGPPQHTRFVGSSIEHSRRFAALGKRKQQSQCTVEAKRARREQEKVQKKKAGCGESLQARYKLCSFFMFDSTVVVLELHGLPACAMHTYSLVQRSARHHAMCSPSFNVQLQCIAASYTGAGKKDEKERLVHTVWS